MQYAIALVVVPIALLGLLELGLRVFGCGHSTQCLVRRDFGGEVFYLPNENFYQQFFGFHVFNVAIDWDEAEFHVPAKKTGNAYRIFVFGGSAAAGYPDAANGFLRILEVMLQARFPDTRFEVYCAAFPGMNSHVMRVAAKACAKLEPDLFVVYMGNNECIGPYGLQTEFSRNPLLWRLAAIRAHIALADLRIAQLGGVSRQEIQRPPLGIDMLSGLLLRYDRARFEKVLDFFRTNIEDICDEAERAGARAILCTLGTNMKRWRDVAPSGPPQLSKAEQLELGTSCLQGLNLEKAGDHLEALRMFERALAIDGTNSLPHWWAGRCCWKLGEFDKALDHSLCARDLATEDMTQLVVLLNDIVTNVSASQAQGHVYLADVGRSLAEHSRDGRPGIEFFSDHCHFTFEGNYVLASTVFEQVVTILPDEVRARGDGEATPLSQHECEVRLAFTPAVKLRNLEGTSSLWPLCPALQEYFAQRRAEMAALVGPDRLANEIDGYRKAIEINPKDYLLQRRHVLALLASGDGADALGHARMLVCRFPHRRGSHRALGLALAACGQLSEAIGEFRVALAQYAGDAETHIQLGNLLRETGESGQALEAYRRALAINPRYSAAKCGEGEILAQRGELLRAVSALREAAAIAPDDEVICERLDALFVRLFDHEGRLAEWRQMAHAHPDAPPLLFHLGMALEEGGDTEGAAEAYSKAADRVTVLPVCPCNVELLARVGHALVRTGDPTGAMAVYRRIEALGYPNAEVRCEIAALAHAKGDRDTAMEMYRQAIATDPAASLPYEKMDALFIEHNELQARVAEWRETASRFPDTALPHHHLARALEDSGDLDGASAEYQIAAALDPQYAAELAKTQAQAWLQMAAQLEEEGEWAEAAALYSQAAAAVPQDAAIEARLGTALEALGDLDAAAQAYGEAIGIAPEVPGPYDSLDAVLSARTGVQGRVAGWQAMAADHPDAARVRFYLGMALEANDDIDGAVDAYRKAGQLDPHDPAMRAFLAEALMRKGDFKSACPVLRAALELNPDMPHVRIELVRALCELEQYDMARQEAQACRDKGIELPSDVSEGLAEIPQMP